MRKEREMRHVLKHPHYPYLVQAWAGDEPGDAGCGSHPSVNDNDEDPLDELSDPFFELLARIEIAETRLW